MLLEVFGLIRVVAMACNTTTVGLACPGVRCCDAVAALRECWCDMPRVEYEKMVEDSFAVEDCLVAENGTPPPCERRALRWLTFSRFYENLPYQLEVEEVGQWFDDMERTMTPDFIYRNLAGGQHDGIDEASEYLLLYNEHLNQGQFSIADFHIREILEETDSYIFFTVGFRTAIKFYGQTIEDQPLTTTNFNFTFREVVGDASDETKVFRMTGFLAPTWPDYDFFAGAIGTPRDLCARALYICPNGLYPYDSFPQCAAHLSHIPQRCGRFGEGGVFTGDSLDCRWSHLSLALLDPVTHCPHLATESTRCRVDDCASDAAPKSSSSNSDKSSATH